MKNVHMLLLVCFLSLGFSCCAQTSFIKKGQAFISETSPGTEMLDDSGKPVVQQKIVNYSVYVEISGAAPEWKYVWYGDDAFTVNPVKIEERKLEVGINKATGEKIVLTPAKGNKLWYLELVPAKNPFKNTAKPKRGEMIIEGIRQNKAFQYRIQKVTVLQTPDAV